MGVVCAGALLAQKKFSWQNACFNNPGAPYCPGADFAVKKQKPGKKSDSSTTSTSPNAALTAITTEHPSPTVIVAGGVNWRFADPDADSLASFSFTGLTGSAVAKSVMSALGANEGVSDADLQKAFAAFAGVDQVAVSSRGDQTVIW